MDSIFSNFVRKFNHQVIYNNNNLDSDTKKKYRFDDSYRTKSIECKQKPSGIRSDERQAGSSAVGSSRQLNREYTEKNEKAFIVIAELLRVIPSAG